MLIVWSGFTACPGVEELSDELAEKLFDEHRKAAEDPYSEDPSASIQSI